MTNNEAELEKQVDEILSDNPVMTYDGTKDGRPVLYFSLGNKKKRILALITEQTRKARIDELEESNRWALTSSLSFASSHKWYAHYSDRLDVLKQPHHKAEE